MFNEQNILSFLKPEEIWKFQMINKDFYQAFKVLDKTCCITFRIAMTRHFNQVFFSKEVLTELVYHTKMRRNPAVIRILAQLDLWVANCKRPRF